MMDERLRRAAEVLSGAPEVALVCHVNPDPDALGSLLGLSAFLRARGVRTVGSFGNEPFELPRWVAALPGADVLVAPRDFPRSPEVVVTMDTASIDRLGNLNGPVARAREVVWIDHHASNPGLGTVPLIDPHAASTAEIVFRLMKAMGGEIPAGAAACLYAGMVTDTGRFQYQATTPETLRLAAELREVPFDHAALAQALFEDLSVGYLKVLATVLQRVELVPSAGLVWTYLLQADVAEGGIDMTETDEVIDVVRTAREADVAAVIKQQRDGRFKVSLRSRGGTDVAAIASAHGGGGHRLAAGFTSRVGLEETAARLVRDLEAARAPAPS
ncbi:MAG: bifunctional oligoribonuclease/PAP phosphatase NrnA [Actinobacteria bacterium]|nr:bifunctional oligoribonuclease/PAP phosphatase NrnA [Actinomycetota bacterium]